MLELSNLVTEVVSLSRQVGAFIRQEGRNFDWSKVEQKNRFNDLVSYVDKQAEEKFVQKLKELLPEAGFITEEDTTAGPADLYNWVIDPVDGTTNFLHGLPLFCTSVALIKNHEIILGVVYEINRDECFYAIQGGKAYCNDQEIKVSQLSQLDQSLIATGFPYADFEKMPAYLDIFNHFMRNSHGLRRLGSAAADLAYVACGRLEGFFEFNLSSWDLAAGALIVKQAGGIVTDFKGGDDYLFGRQLVAGNAAQPAMLKVIQDHWYKNE